MSEHIRSKIRTPAEITRQKESPRYTSWRFSTVKLKIELSLLKA